MRLLYRTFKEKLKIQRHHPFKFGFGFTLTCIMVVYENVVKSGTNPNKIMDFRHFASLLLNVHYHAEET